jgi:hypothetical protein
MYVFLVLAVLIPMLCRHAPVSKTGVNPYVACLAEGGLPTSGTNPSLVGE